MIILNFSHPLTQEQKEQIRQKAGISKNDWNNSRVIRVNCYINIEKDLPRQINQILENIPNYVWNGHVMIVPPPIAHSAILISIGIRERCGYYPQAIRIKRVTKSLPPKFVVAEVIDLNNFKEKSRSMRDKKSITTVEI